MKKTIILVTPQLGRGKGGLGVSAERIFGHLATEYRVIAVVPGADLPAGEFESAQANGLIEVVRISDRGEPKQADQFLADCLSMICRESGAAALGSFYAGRASFPVAVSAREAGLPYFVFCRGNDIDLEIFGEHFARIEYALKHAALVFAVSEEMRAKVESLDLSRRCVNIANGISLADYPFLNAENHGRLRCGIFGDIKEKKGLPFLLENLDFENFDLTINGAVRDDQAKLLHGFLLMAPEYAERISQSRFTSDRLELIERYRAVDVVCIPSRHEGMPNVLLEAMALGRLCVAARVGGIPDVVRHGVDGFLFEPTDAADFSRAMDQARNALISGRAKEIIAEARRRIETAFTSERERLNYLAAVREILVNRSKPDAVVVPGQA